MKYTCHECGSNLLSIVSHLETVTINGSEVEFTATLTKCLRCGVEFEGSGQLNKNLEAAREAYALTIS